MEERFGCANASEGEVSGASSRVRFLSLMLFRTAIRAAIFLDPRAENAAKRPDTT